MNNIEKLKEYQNEIDNLQKKFNVLEEEANNVKWNKDNYEQAAKQFLVIDKKQKEIKAKLTNADFKKRIVLNNLYSIAIEAIENQGYKIVEKYLKRNIGEKTIQKIEDEFNAILTPLTGFNVYVRYKIYTNVYQNVESKPCFCFSCHDLGIDTEYYIENEAFQCRYNMEQVEQVEDVEKEAEKLTSAYYEAIEKTKYYENEMKKYHDDFVKNFKRNTYTNNVSLISNNLFYMPKYVD
jgi:hypothetical protein